MLALYLERAGRVAQCSSAHSAKLLRAVITDVAPAQVVNDLCEKPAYSKVPVRSYAKKPAGRRLNIPPKDFGRESFSNTKVYEHLEAFVDAAEPIHVPKEELDPDTAAQDKARAREYNKMKMAEHRAWQRDINTLIKLQKDAISALPPELQAAAMVPDMNPFPSRRHIFYETPPKKGVVAANIDQATKKRR
ncbi:hypothetical protein CYMTET_16010 [Cymbomonas tetramitiformis]|uniref:Uncharacterized protein n=1 Tax=Cymbomonas tetramitiformis TaxID=36881 RepID=A0AAE0L8C4_9CHLO|nr:hypothetical protein CYMTET_16010 [Cymbomonas tetramitiformis]